MQLNGFRRTRGAFELSDLVFDACNICHSWGRTFTPATGTPPESRAPSSMALSPYRLRDERLQLEALVDSLELAPLGSCQFVRAYSPCSAVDLRSKLAAGDSNVGFSPRWRAPARGMAAPQPRVASMRAYRPRAAPSSSFCRPRRARGPFSRRRSGASRPKEPGMGQRLARGLDRRPCERCGHQQGLHVERDGRIVCVVCDRASQLWPCSTTRLEAEPSATC